MVHFPTLVPFFLVSFAAANTPPALQYIFSNPPSINDFRIPSVHESAVLARRMLHLSSIATVSTVFPAHDAISANRPSNIGGSPIGLMEYYAACPPYQSDPTILAISIATAIKNAAAGSNVTLSLRYHVPPPSTRPPAKDPYTYSAANLPRFSLIGHIGALSSVEVRAHNISGCFLERHPDAKPWTPGNDIHESYWARLVVKEIYWFGGFGDRAYIGWIPERVWRNVSMQEVEAVRLPGEEGWRQGELMEVGWETEEI
ncbi:MAG: hypothetical protein LQ347_001235 [Umbilicaria vellea]|nr:MAG: hypothetical protein LQ347_001235 [Umbilicaria vellea]